MCIRDRYMGIEDTYIEIPSMQSLLLNSFSYNANGRYEFELRSEHETANAQLVLLVVGKGESCNSIGISCKYDILKWDNVCASVSAEALDEYAVNVYPVLVLAEMYSLAAGVHEYNANGWKGYVNTSELTLTDHIDGVLRERVFESFESNHSITESANAKTITTYAVDTIKTSSHIYFAFINCNVEAVQLIVKYTLLNPSNEQLSSNDIPHKVLTLFTLANPHLPRFFLGPSRPNLSFHPHLHEGVQQVRQSALPSDLLRQSSHLCRQCGPPLLLEPDLCQMVLLARYK
eukprot:TRINITY_DN9998_c0_g1_i3.p1 TRINITY_DN9998_c0_g1~~TRINITY_DN9998_c0_g1_i3.p1  ORF type:complete len:289 (-),score=13.53 TRINITY_DN9998_c0_g1_i3:270-1136(-)